MVLRHLSIPFVVSEDEIVAHLSSKGFGCLIGLNYLMNKEHENFLHTIRGWNKNNDNSEGLTFLTNQEALNNEGDLTEY